MFDRNADGSSDEEYEPAVDEELDPLQDGPGDVDKWPVISARLGHLPDCGLQSTHHALMEDSCLLHQVNMSIFLPNER
uniref:Uncharacterized protein n=1 Tax=Nymphaea colorata TaxID=210225 RepID=A0A5K1CPN5_9MAGN